MTSRVPVNGGKKLEGRDVGATLRFDLELAPPTEEATNEFSYVLLMKDAEKDSKKVVVTIKDPLLPKDPLNGEDNDSVAALARKFEEKYGPKKRKRVLHESDMIDRGMGYDLADPFVDDSELYENYVPHQLDTKFGGFYVNTGRLEFKPATDLDEDSQADFIEKKSTKKPKMKKIPSYQSTPQAILASQKLKKAKQRAALQKAPPTASAAKASDSSPFKPPPNKKRKQSKPKFIIPPASAIGGVEDTWSDSGGSQPMSASPSLLTGAVISSLSAGAKGAAGTAGIKTANLSSKLSKDSNSALKGLLGVEGMMSSDGPVQQQQQVPKEPPTLPENLPPDVFTKVVALEQLIAKDQDAGGGKLSNKARNSYDEHLVNIQECCQGLKQKVKYGLFEYLAYKMGVARATLMKRMKHESKKREDTELEKYITDLKRAIDAAMPEQIQQYEKEVRARHESMSSQAEAPVAMEVEEESKLEDVFDDATNVSTCTSTATNLSAAATPPVAPPEKIKRPPVRKRFKWTDEIRKLLYAVVKAKILFEETSRSAAAVKADWEEIIGSFLENKIKPLWPKGWMQKSILYKTSEIAHKHLTNPLNRKVVPVKKEKQPVSVVRKDQSILPATQKVLTSTSSSLQTAPSISTLISASTAPTTPSLPQTLPPIPTKPPTSGQKPPHIFTTATKTGKDSSLQSSQLKPAKLAIPKTTKKATITLGSPPTTSSVATYLLSAGNIEQLLQAHLQQKAGGSIQLFTSTTASSGQNLQGVKIVSVTTAAPKTVRAKVGGHTAVSSVGQATKVTPAVIQSGSSAKSVTTTATQQRLPTSPASSAKQGFPARVENINLAVSQVGYAPKLAQATKMTSVVKPVPTSHSTVIHANPAAKPSTSPSVSAAVVEKAGRPSANAIAAAMDISKLESVVSKIVGTLAKHPLEKTSGEVGHSGSTSSSSAGSANRLHLTKKGTVSSPQVIFPGHQSESHLWTGGGGGGGSVSTVTNSSTPATTASSYILTSVGGAERSLVGVAEQVSVTSTTCTPPPLTLGDMDDITPPLAAVTCHAGSSHSKIPPPLLAVKPTMSPDIATPSPTSRYMTSGVPSTGSSVRMIPDTPPVPTSPHPLPFNHHDGKGGGGLQYQPPRTLVGAVQGMDTEKPCLSPLKSPMEQILGEHSYLGANSQ